MRIKLLLTGVLPSVISFFMPRISKRIVFCSEFNCFFNYCSKHLFLYFLSNYSERYEVKFVINDEKRRRELTSIYGDYFITNYRISDVLYIIGANTWITSSLETPIGGIFLSFRRKVFHLGHGAPIKAIGLAEKKRNLKKVIYYAIVKTNFSYFFSTSQVFDKAWQDFLGVNSKKIIRGGQPRNDMLFSSEVPKILKSDSSILYAPTWRPYRNTELFPFDDFKVSELSDFLKAKNIELYIRLHPNFESEIDDQFLKYDNIKLLSKSSVDDIYEVLSGFDCLITDYSSIYVDYLLTDRPVIFIPYDYLEYSSRVGFSIDYTEYSPGHKPKSFNEFKEAICDALGNDVFSNKRQVINNILNPIGEDQCKNTAEIIISIIR